MSSHWLYFRRSVRSCAVGFTSLIGVVPGAYAQTAPPPAAPAASAPITTLAPVIITANPFGSRALASPASVLAGDELTLRRGSSLGETLNSMPGVSSSYFGPNANRPVIRGLDGDRVRVLSNAAASLDASSLSFDHAVPIDPLFVERLEVLRGPAALMYGGSAIGGVVNALDNRIPKERIDTTGGVAEARLGGAQSERGGAAMVEAGNSQFALHADAFGRETKDLRVPMHTPVEDGAALPSTPRMRNSASRASGGAVGASAFFDQGRIGFSADTYDSRYGVVVEPDVVIRMKREHIGVSGELKLGEAPIRSIKAQVNRTDYRHQEIEGSGEIGTTFNTTGNELRIEAEHASIGTMRGMLGVQAEDFDFSALGEEAFVPSTRTRRHAVFALEELPWAGGTLSAGLRLERARVHSNGDADPGAPQFGPAAERRFSMRSASVANFYKFAPQWSVSSSLSFTERAPTSFELFANGVHAATSAYERGDASLRTEQARNIDLALQWDDGNSRWRAGVFQARFSRFISLDATGNDVTVGADTYPEYAFRSVRARLSGIEIDGKQRLHHRPEHQGAWTLDLSGKLDIARGHNLDSGEPLPRMAPLRTLIGLEASRGPWSSRIEWDHAARQNLVPSFDAPTESYDIVNVRLSRRFGAGSSEGLWFIQLSNITDELGYNAASVQTVRGLSPLPGRSLKTGVRIAF